MIAYPNYHAGESLDFCPQGCASLYWAIKEQFSIELLGWGDNLSVASGISL